MIRSTDLDNVLLYCLNSLRKFKERSEQRSQCGSSVFCEDNAVHEALDSHSPSGLCYKLLIGVHSY